MAEKDVQSLEAGIELDMEVAKARHPYWVFGPGPFRPSTHMADAWPLAVEMRASLIHSEDGVYCIVPKDVRHHPCEHEVVDGLWVESAGEGMGVIVDLKALAPTGPLAICRAYLLWKTP